ncbi:MAG: response regulator transcription factor [Candidatus Hydrogenedentes bacterium]|nr:response regulator transcription factor [Candidatus Hydrogenedentota bacterium]
MRLLYIEDSARLQTHVGKGLRQAGFAVDSATDGEAGLWMATENGYDVIILDRMLPRMDGIEVLRRLRESGCTTHVLLLTAKDRVEDRVEGLQEGADDYLVKPFAFEELLARVQALVRRAHGVKHKIIEVGALRLDLVARSAHVAGEAIALRPREYALLELLAFHPGETVSRTEIERHIYDERADPMSNVVDSAICQLRKKVDVPGQASHIRTRRGLGYALQDPRT